MAFDRMFTGGSCVPLVPFPFAVNLMSREEAGPFPARPQVVFSLCVQFPSSFYKIYKIPVYKVMGLDWYLEVSFYF